MAWLLAQLLPCSAETGTVADELAKSERTATFLRAMTDANLITQLADLGPFTVFAPTEDAFTLLGPGMAESLIQPQNKEILLELMQYHLAYTQFNSAVMQEGMTIRTLQGTDVEVTSLQPTRVNVDCRISSPDQPATNGVIHIVDRVLVPAGFQFPAPESNIVQLPGRADYLSMFRRMLTAAGMEGTLTADGQDYTVFAPTNDAFEALGQGVATSLLLEANKPKLRSLMFGHVLFGRQKTTTYQPAQNLKTMEGGFLQVTATSPLLKVNLASTVISRDVEATNGFLNVVSNVILPTDFTYPDQSIVQIVSKSPELSFLYEALEAADMLESLSGQDGPVTLLAPTNAAWESLGSGFARSLLLPSSRSKLVQLLRYHLLVGTKRSIDVSEGDLVQTLAMGTLEVRSVTPFTVDTAKSNTQDVPCTDGIAHVVDKVLIPEKWVFPERDSWNLVKVESDLTKFRNALAVCGLEHYLEENGPVTIFAPTDAAFDALGDFTLEHLFSEERRDELLEVMSYHIVQQRVESNTMTYSQKITTMEGRQISVTPWTDQGWLGVVHDRFTSPATVNGEAKLVAPDCLVTNGLVHKIDKVLMPPGYDPPVLTTEWKFVTSSSRMNAALGVVSILLLALAFP